MKAKNDERPAEAVGAPVPLAGPALLSRFDPQCRIENAKRDQRAQKQRRAAVPRHRKCPGHKRRDDHDRRADQRIELQSRTQIKSYVTEHKMRPITTKERIMVGARVPADVELAPVPSVWGPSATKYRYVYSNDRVMLVDPGCRTVVQEID